MKKMQIILGLFVLMFVLWITTSVVSVDGQSLFGASWDLGYVCCDGATTMSCTDGPPGTQSSCNPNYSTWVARTSGYTGYFSTPGPVGDDMCDLGGFNCPGSNTYCSDGSTFIW